MVAVTAPFGLDAAYSISGQVRATAYPNGISSGYGTAIYKGSPVMMNTTGYLSLAAATTDNIIGVFAGVEYNDGVTGKPTESPFWGSGQTYSGTMTAYVWDDPTIFYYIQASGAVAQSALGDQGNFTTVTAGSTNTGISGAQLNATLTGSGNQGQLRIVGLAPSPFKGGGENAWGDAFTAVTVQIAEHQYVANKVAL